MEDLHHHLEEELFSVCGWCWRPRGHNNGGEVHKKLPEIIIFEPSLVANKTVSLVSIPQIWKCKKRNYSRYPWDIDSEVGTIKGWRYVHEPAMTKTRILVEGSAIYTFALWFARQYHFYMYYSCKYHLDQLLTLLLSYKRQSVPYLFHLKYHCFEIARERQIQKLVLYAIDFMVSICLSHHTWKNGFTL